MAFPRAYAFLFIVVGLQGNSGFLLDDLANHVPHEVCYGVLGCFNNGPPFLSIQNPLSVPPESPSVIHTRFLLYTRRNPTRDVEQELIAGVANSLTSSNYDGSLPTKFIIHGFTHNAHRPWVQTLASELLKHGDYNVIAVDWQKGASLPYEQATANTRVVGAQTAVLIKALMQQTNQTADMFHIIGHSLGAQTAGYAGERVPGLGHITGLDPAAPLFENTDVKVRLDPTDAKFVDVIHTDDGGVKNIGFGVTQPSGHIDFYPNGGSRQPGCSSDALDKLGHTVWTALTSQLDMLASEEALACSHERSYQYYIESINSACQFKAYPCSSLDEFNLGHCTACPPTGCPAMGFGVKQTDATGSMFLKTEATPTFCGHWFMLDLGAANGFDGILTATLTGTGGTSKHVQLMTSNEPHAAKTTFSEMFMVRENVGDVTSITLHYEKTHAPLLSALYSDHWRITGVHMWNFDTATKQTFCADHMDLDNHNSTTFRATTGSC